MHATLVSFSFHLLPSVKLIFWCLERLERPFPKSPDCQIVLTPPFSPSRELTGRCYSFFFFNPVINLMDSVLKVFFLLSSSSPSPSFPPASSRLTSLGLWDPVCDTDLSVLAGGRQRGALHEENLLQTAAALLHSPGHWHTLLQRPVSAHPRGRVHAAATHSAADTTCPCVMTGRSIWKTFPLVCSLWRDSSPSYYWVED